MQWASAISQQNSLRAALSECAASVGAAMGDAAPDLAVVFAASEYAADYASLPELAGELLGPRPWSWAAPAGASSAAAPRWSRNPPCP